MNDQKEAFHIFHTKFFISTDWFLCYFLFSDERTKGGLLANFAIQDFCSIPGHWTLFFCHVFNEGFDTVTNLFLRVCANWHGHLVPGYGN